MRSPHIVTLSVQVVKLLERLRPLTSQGEYLFPGRNLKTKPLSDMALNAALRYLGYNSDRIESQLAHVERIGVRADNNHADWLPERRKMMREWADLLDELATEAAKR